MWCRLLALVLCLSLPVQGWAGLALPPTPCHMSLAMAAEQATAAAAAAASPAAAAADIPETAATDAEADCCNDLSTWLRTGQACKGGPDGNAPVLCLPPVAALTTQVQTLALVPCASPTLAAPGLPATVWRPPALR